MATPDSHAIVRIVQGLKDERDEWETKAQFYKAAFEMQNKQLREALDICVATQAELQNERLIHERNCSAVNRNISHNAIDSTIVHSNIESSIKSSIEDDFDFDWESASSSNSTFDDVKNLVYNEGYAAGLRALDRILPGPLSHESRVEGLLLKSAMLRVSGGTQWLYDALAQCSEALELCSRISDLAIYLPKIQYQRGVCLYQLGMFSQAHEAFQAIDAQSELHEQAVQYCKSCDESERSHARKRRSAFEEHRNYAEGGIAFTTESGTTVRNHSFYLQESGWLFSHSARNPNSVALASLSCSAPRSSPQEILYLIAGCFPRQLNDSGVRDAV
ncbi:hypothetical protein BU24DRAFT_134906 [Aaosphaeria arxii CBS 175.79]|uniref:Uncharacterized protein n=1 Tax=Aaosphaeria arxii CBS 175.79 TaxID=1450172 RepID=A0A6A5Y6I2_9PLEO|nr:uncharacterized protein BU24DRAFT_134906 [Aaosphaeria arxii CBS 175.79]KAF2020174.1 hypothetical protein BU24DRAFT_134906 [Aaosphaeria arxii CBS 175.79]